MTKLMGTLGLGERLREEEVTKAWQEIVGEFVAKHSASAAPGKKGCSPSACCSRPSTTSSIASSKPKLLAKLKARFGATVIRELKFRIG